MLALYIITIIVVVSTILYLAFESSHYKSECKEYKSKLEDEISRGDLLDLILYKKHKDYVNISRNKSENDAIISMYKSQEFISKNMTQKQ